MDRLTDRMGVNSDSFFDNVKLTKTVTDTVRVYGPLRWYALHSERFGMKFLHMSFKTRSYTTLGSTYSEFGYNEHPATTSK